MMGRCELCNVELRQKQVVLLAIYVGPKKSSTALSAIQKVHSLHENPYHSLSKSFHPKQAHLKMLLIIKFLLNTVEPPISRHPWDQKKCLLMRGVHKRKFNCNNTLY